MTATSIRALAIAAALAAGCEGKLGTLRVELVTAPGSPLLDGVVRARLTLTDPHEVVEADRSDPGGLALEVDAEGQPGELWFEGFDAGGARIAVGSSGPVPIAAIDSAVKIYVAPPISIAAAPAALAPPRADLGAAPLRYGVLFAGGTDAAGAPTDHLVIYNVYAHDFQIGEHMPAPRSALAVGMGASGFAYLFGGKDASGQATGTLWRFDTNVRPAGRYDQLPGDPALARAGVEVAPIGRDAFLVAGAPPAVIDGLSLAVRGLAVPDRLGGTATTVSDSAGSAAVSYTVFVGDGNGTTGVVRYTTDAFTEIPAPPDAARTGHGAVATADAKVVVLAGATRDGLIASAVRIDPAGQTATSIPNVLATPRRDAAIAGNGRVAVVAGGIDAGGALIGDAEILDLATLARITTLPLVVPRSGAAAFPLPNGQILIAGGRGSDGAPVGTLELFTPDLPDT